MFLARYAPVGSLRYEKLANKSKSFDKIMEWLPAQWFSIWTVIVAGIATGKGYTDRFYFWDFSDWKIGLFEIFIAFIIIGVLGFKSKYFPVNNISATFKSIKYHLLLAFILFWMGNAITSMILIGNAAIYVMAYFAIFILYTIEYDGLKKKIISQKNKNEKSGIAILLLLIAGVIGYVLNDPLISTASMVSLPFLIVLLFGKHVRHLERAKFYPIFIFAMFVVSREGWFLIPLLLLFFILRSYNYLRYQKVYPTFGITDDQN